jgi:sortase (surface protein transpeptidase)
VADPARVRIPAIGVDAAIRPLQVDGQGVLPPPPANEDSGWWRAGPEPGEQGPAVIVGHVDSQTGPAVFFRLPQLTPGDEIAVDRVDGSTAVFVVQRIEQHPKDVFPTEAVYGSTPGAELRLVTCGGEFDRGTRHYVDNVIVYAALAA